MLCENLTLLYYEVKRSESMPLGVPHFPFPILMLALNKGGLGRELPKAENNARTGNGERLTAEDRAHGGADWASNIKSGSNPGIRHL